MFRVTLCSCYSGVRNSRLMLHPVVLKWKQKIAWTVPKSNRKKVANSMPPTHIHYRLLFWLGISSLMKSWRGYGFYMASKYLFKGVALHVLIVTFNNISVILYRSVLLVERKTTYPEQITDILQVIAKFYHAMMYHIHLGSIMNLVIISGTTRAHSVKSI